MSAPSGNCPHCDATIELKPGVMASEIVTCSSCKNRVVVQNIDGETATLIEAPAVEQDWGE